jgi:aldehyde dehydrogenase (NAD+)
MAETPQVNPEPMMLIDGKLVEASGSKTFQNLNPATEEELGEVADASSEDMQRAIAAARRAFDDTDWSDQPVLPPTLPRAAPRRRSIAEREEMREQLILEVGCPRMLTSGPQLDAPLDGAITYPAQLIDEYAWETDLPDAPDFRGNHNFRRIRKEADRCGRCHRPVELPLRGLGHQAGSSACHRQHRRSSSRRPDTPWNATLLGRTVGRAAPTSLPAS